MERVKKLAELRTLMADHAIDAWIVPSADPHQSEYVAEHWGSRAWVSGFTGSAGIFIITTHTAGLWTDARYHQRAERELTNSDIQLFKQGKEGVPTYQTWLAQTLPAGGTVGFDGQVFSVKDVKILKHHFQGKNINLVHTHDFMRQIWADRPPIPQHPIFLHDAAFAGESRQSKIERIRKQLVESKADAHLLTALDDIAWTFNMRGQDVDFNPVAICYALITETEARLFIDAGKVPQAVQTQLVADGVSFSEYGDVFKIWEEMPALTIYLDPEKTNYTLHQAITPHCHIKQGRSVPTSLKAVKNDVEIAGIRQAHIRDGIAINRWMMWLESQVGQHPHDEISLATKLTEFMAKGDHFQGLSFSTIMGYRSNSAVGHYKPLPKTTMPITANGLLLVDAGAHYLDGTTDITRTFSLGIEVTTKQKTLFTTVLKSHIALATAKFPKGTTGGQLDNVSRAPLWQAGFNCRHGIGHGVGHFLNVHEGPQSFGKKNHVPLEVGMVVTNEPGVYFEGEYGVRLENVMVIMPAESTIFADFYHFETITLCPFDRTLIEKNLLTQSEIAWINQYHKRVYVTLSPFLSDIEQVWLAQKTEPI